MKIEISEYTKKFKKNIVLDNISLTMQSGNIYGLQGHNGSGKTMLMRAICGLILPDSGYIKIDGKRLGKDISFPESLGFLLESPSFLGNFSALENLKKLSSLKNKTNEETLCQLLLQVGLDPYDKKKYKKFSLGMKQKLGIACAIMDSPNLILLDEPFNALDKDSVQTIKKIILRLRTPNRIIILSCHNKNDLMQLSDIIFELDNGKLITSRNEDCYEM